MESQSIRHLQFGRSSRSLRLQTLIWLRWLAVAGQALTVFVVAVVLHFTGLPPDDGQKSPRHGLFLQSAVLK